MRKLFIGLFLFFPGAAYGQPSVVEAETQRLVFRVSPLTSEGDAAKQAQWILKGWKLPILAVRAFVVGADQAEPARKAIEDFFKKRKQTLPAISVITVAGLPRSGAKVSIEVALLFPKPVNPNGLAFVSGMAGSSPQPVAELLPLAEKAVKDLNASHRAAGVEASDVLRVTCLMTSLADVVNVAREVKRAFPQSAANFVQLQRAPKSAVIECETVARLRTAPEEPLKFIYSDELQKSPNFSHVALVGARRLVFTSLHVSTGDQESDARQTFARLEQSLKSVGASIKQVAMSSLYPISQEASDLVRKTRFDFYDRARPPASTMLLFEGLPSSTATFGVNVVAVKH